MSMCAYFPACRGCDLWDKPYEKQAMDKLLRLKTLLRLPDSFANQTENFISVKPFGLRHRFDFTFEIGEEQKMGYYNQQNHLLDLPVCLQLSPELQQVFTEFRSYNINAGTTAIRKGSVRLRVGPTGIKGCWLDLANIDIKALLDDSTYLNELLKADFAVEIGQKAKHLQRVDGRLKLGDPKPLSWFKTKSFNLLSYVSDFTQPGWHTADKMTDLILNWCARKNFKNAIEFGPGTGQFTLPLLASGLTIHAFENNPKAVVVLKENAITHKLSENLKIHFGNFQNKFLDLQHKNIDLVLVNPPRSGLKNFVHSIVSTKAKFCIYISCYPQSMQIDILELQKAGYQIIDAKIVDQFPQTSHFESCVLLEKV